MDALLEEQRGVTVPKIVESDPGNPGAFGYPAKVPLYDIVRV